MIQLMRKRIFPEEMEILYDRPFTPESLAGGFADRCRARGTYADRVRTGGR